MFQLMVLHWPLTQTHVTITGDIDAASGRVNALIGSASVQKASSSGKMGGISGSGSTGGIKGSGRT
jgi:hypothetical protein